MQLDITRARADYNEPLPFSAQLRDALKFAHHPGTVDVTVHVAGQVIAFALAQADHSSRGDSASASASLRLPSPDNLADHL